MKNKIILFIIAGLLLWLASCSPAVKFVVTETGLKTGGDSQKVYRVQRVHNPYHIRKPKDKNVTLIYHTKN